MGDRDAVMVESSLRPHKIAKPTRKVHIYRKADYAEFGEDLRNFKDDFLEQAERSDVNQLWTRFKDKIISGMEKYVPSKLLKGTKHRKPWATKPVKALQSKQKKLFTKKKKTKSSKSRIWTSIQRSESSSPVGRKKSILELHRQPDRSRR